MGNGFIVLTRDDFSKDLEFVINQYGRPKIFESKDKAYFYCKKWEIFPSQIVELVM